MPFLYYKNNANRAQKRQACLGDYAEMQLIFYKNNANRAQKRQACLSDYAEMQLIFYKNNANRAQKRQACLGDYAEMQLIFYKDTIFVESNKSYGLRKSTKKRQALFQIWHNGLCENRAAADNSIQF